METTEKKKIIVEIEGRKILVDAAIAADDDTLKRAFSTIFAWAIDARVERSKEGEGLIKLVKAAGTKGKGGQKKKRLPYPLRRLTRCKGGMNPVIELYQTLEGQQIGRLSAEEVLVLGKKVRKTLDLGEQQRAMMKKAMERLLVSLPRPSPILPAGF